MVKIIIGTTPTIHYNFRVADPEDFTAAYLTIKDAAGGSITAHMMTTEATDNMLNALPARTTAATLTIPGSQTRRASDGVIAAAEARGWTIKAS